MGIDAKNISISVCTICMNRLHHIKETLPKNIQDNLDYPDVNFVLLDYSSTDGLHIWIKENMYDHLQSGKLIYYRYDHAIAFHRSHSRNLAFKAAPGEVICNVDADNYTGQGFAKYINAQFTNNRNIFLTTIDFFGTNKGYRVPRDVMGRICVNKDAFLKVQGFDERMINYGFEDYDLTNRIEMLGSKRVLIQGEEFLKFIEHSDDGRYSMDTKNINISSLYVCYINPWESIILILFENHSFGLSGIIDKTTIDADDVLYAYTKRKLLFQHYLKDNKWHRGTWYIKSPTKINLEFDEGKSKVLNTQGDTIVDPENNTFYLIRDESLINWVSVFHIAIENRIIMEENLLKKTIAVNNGGFGMGKMIRNFSQLC